MPDVQVEVAAIGHYGGLARTALEPLLRHQQPHVRSRARLALRAVGPSEQEVDALAAVADAAFVAGKLPDVATVLILHESGFDILPRLIDQLASVPNLRLDSYEHDYRASADFHEAVLEWLRTTAAASVEIPRSLVDVVPFAAPEARRWLAAVEASHTRD